MLKEGQEFKIIMAVFPDDIIPLVDFIEDMEFKDHESAVAVIAHLKKARHSHLHGPPLTKALQGKLKGVYEIRCLSPLGTIRIMFVFEPNQRIVVMNGVLKKSKQFTASEEKQILKYKKLLDAKEATYEEFNFTIFE